MRQNAYRDDMKMELLDLIIEMYNDIRLVKVARAKENAVGEIMLDKLFVRTISLREKRLSKMRPIVEFFDLSTDMDPFRQGISDATLDEFYSHAAKLLVDLDIFLLAQQERRYTKDATYQQSPP